MNLYLLLIALLVIAVAITLVAMAVVRSNRHGSELLHNWAEQNSYHIIHAKRRYMFTGPFPQVITRGAQVYRVEIEDSRSHIRRGWLLCGSSFWGNDPNKTTVHWDK